MERAAEGADCFNHAASALSRTLQMAATEARTIVGGRSDVGELDANEESRAIATLEEGDEERDEPHDRFALDCGKDEQTRWREEVTHMKARGTLNKIKSRVVVEVMMSKGVVVCAVAAEAHDALNVA